MDDNPSTLDAPGAITPLIGPDDPPPYQAMNEDGRAPMLLICDHASCAFPAAIGPLGLDASQLERHIAWDIGAAEVTRRLSGKLDAMAIIAGYSRLLIDVNRQPGDPGSIPDISDGTIIPGNIGLTETETGARLESFFWPYHHAITNAHAHLWRRGPAPALFSIHSFTPTLAGKERYWHIGTLWNRDPRLSVPLFDKLSKAEGGALHVGDNQPYSGKDLAYTIDLHGAAAGLPNCAVEIRQDLIATDQGAERWASILADAFGDILGAPDLHRAQHF